MKFTRLATLSTALAIVLFINSQHSWAAAQNVTDKTTGYLTPIVSLVLSDNTVKLSDGSEMIIEKDVRIPTRADSEGHSIHLSANIFRPAKGGKYPTLIGMTPYNKDAPISEFIDEEDGDINVSEYTSFELPDPDFWVANGYVVIVVDARGQNLSEGDTAAFTAQEAEDYYDAIEWSASQHWSNGKIGTTGVSYMGINQWRVAELQPPHLKAIMPWDALTDIYRDAAYHGGIYNSGFVEPWWMFRILLNDNKPGFDQDPQDLDGLLASTPTLDPQGPRSFNYSDLTPTQLDQINIPAYIATEWADHGLHTRGTLLGFTSISSPHKWLEVHGRKKWEWYYSASAQDRQRQFFDFFLADKTDNGMLDVPRVTYELRSAYYQGTTHTASDWPLPNLNTNTLFLDASNASTSNSPLVADSSMTYTIPMPEEDREEEVSAPHRVTFNHTFAADTDIIGGMNLQLYVSVSSGTSNTPITDTDLFVGVQKFDSAGEFVNFESRGGDIGQVASGWLRASHRALDISKTTPTQPFHTHLAPTAIPQNSIVQLDIEIQPSATHFAAGETMSIVVQGVDMIRTGEEHDSINVIGSEVTVHTSSTYPSKLIFSTLQP